MTSDAPHIPVLIAPLIKAVSPVKGRWLDGTFGAGGYSRALLAAGAAHVVGVDRDPAVFEMAKEWASDYGPRLSLIEGTFGQMDEYAQNLDGVVLDLGVSSMQLDQAERGFSFMKDGPLDMRMAQSGPSAADLVNEADEAVLADILYLYGEERASRAIARAIVRTRPFARTSELAKVIEGVLPRPKPGQAHPATRSFQALRIAVNDEYGQLFAGLLAAERALRPGGLLAVVTFHSIEDRMVKRFFKLRAGKGGNANRFAPAQAQSLAQFELISRKAIAADEAEAAQNPRARSAKLRVARRLDAPSTPIDPATLGMPQLKSAHTSKRMAHK